MIGVIVIPEKDIREIKVKFDNQKQADEYINDFKKVFGKDRIHFEPSLATGR